MSNSPRTILKPLNIPCINPCDSVTPSKLQELIYDISALCTDTLLRSDCDRFAALPFRTYQSRTCLVGFLILPAMSQRTSWRSLRPTSSVSHHITLAVEEVAARVRIHVWDGPSHRIVHIQDSEISRSSRRILRPLRLRRAGV